MDTYKFLLRLTEEEKAKLLKIQKRISNKFQINVSINETIKYLINKENLDNDKEK